MEQILVFLGFLLLIYGLYILINGIKADPVLKGSLTAIAGTILILFGYMLAKRRVKNRKSEEGWDYR